MSADSKNTSGHQCCLMPDGKHETWCPYSGEYHWLRTAEFVESLRARLKALEEFVRAYDAMTIARPGRTGFTGGYPRYESLAQRVKETRAVLDAAREVEK